MGETAIQIDLNLSELASGPVSGSTWATLVRIDGSEHRFRGGKSHVIPCSPGEHEVEIEFAAAGLQFIAAWLGYKAGLEKKRVRVDEGQTVKLVYRGGVFWKYGDHSLSQVV